MIPYIDMNRNFRTLKLVGTFSALTLIGALGANYTTSISRQRVAERLGLDFRNDSKL